MCQAEKTYNLSREMRRLGRSCSQPARINVACTNMLWSCFVMGFCPQPGSCQAQPGPLRLQPWNGLRGLLSIPAQRLCSSLAPISCLVLVLEAATLRRSMLDPSVNEMLNSSVGLLGGPKAGNVNRQPQRLIPIVARALPRISLAEVFAIVQSCIDRCLAACLKLLRACFHCLQPSQLYLPGIFYGFDRLFEALRFLNWDLFTGLAD